MVDADFNFKMPKIEMTEKIRRWQVWKICC